MESEGNVERPEQAPSTAASPTQRRTSRTLALLIGGLLATYVAVAYLVMPLWWGLYVHRHPGLDKVPGITTTKVGIPADPLNVAVVGTQHELIAALLKAKWYPADPLSLKSSIEIAADTVLRRPFDEAPVSSLYLFDRKEDLAFEKPVGHDPRQRNHVRFWKTETPDPDGRPLWVGGATYDRGVGLSHTDGEITHHIAADVDTERDRLMSDLEASGDVAEMFQVDNFHKVKDGRNGGGDPWHTDGTLRGCVLKKRVE